MTFFRSACPGERMKIFALVACWTTVALAAPPPLSVSTAADYPLTCTELAKPLVFKGWEAMVNTRVDQARETLKLALVADPKCVMAKASLGMVTPRQEGRALFEAAMQQLSGLTEVEQLDLRAMQAARNGDLRKAFTLSQQLAQLAPNVLMPNLTLANNALELEEWDAAAAAATQATRLSPTNGAGWNLLGYAKLQTHQTAEAIEAFRKYVEVAPDEPNAHDSLGDALLLDNQLESASASYQRAIDESAGKFWLAWSGIATVEAIQGDWVAARAALEGEKAAAIEPLDKLRADTMTAWTWAAQGRLDDALKVVQLAQREAIRGKVDAATARTTLLKAQVQLASGKYADAIKTFRSADVGQIDQLSTGQRKKFKGQVLSGLTVAQARAGKLTDSARSLARLEDYAKANLSGPFATDTINYARGVLAMKRGEAQEAVKSLESCSDTATFCHAALAEAQEAAGQTAAAGKTREQLRKANQRDPEYWFVRARLEVRMRESSM
jgi:tetratricopeptide (TPR) repeat protein